MEESCYLKRLRAKVGAPESPDIRPRGAPLCPQEQYNTSAVGGRASIAPTQTQLGTS